MDEDEERLPLQAPRSERYLEELQGRFAQMGTSETTPREVWVTGTPGFVQACLQEARERGVAYTSGNSTHLLRMGGVALGITELCRWDGWWDERTYIIEGFADGVWVEGSGDVADPDLDPAAQEVYTTLRHEDLWDAADAREAALRLQTREVPRAH